MDLATLIYICGWGQFGILVASALVPFRLDWKTELASLPKLHWQMYWIYGGYVVLSIVALASISVSQATSLAEGSSLARAVCAYTAVFWGVRLGLQAVLDAKPYLTVWWIRFGYHMLTALFLGFTLVYGYAAFRP
jgi:hypothetical protein